METKQVSVQFDLNYETIKTLPCITLEEDTPISLEMKPLPERPGYRFAGWYQDPECTQEWVFGEKKPQFMQPATEWMPVLSDMTLYARWVAPVHISTAQEFDQIRQDLYGWYVLDNDIDLSSYEDWDPIGKYESDYEYADAEWWCNSFKGRLDGNGHTIKGLSIKSVGEHYHLGLFGAMANAEVYNLIFEHPTISVKGPMAYIGALAGGVRRDKGRKVILENITVKNADMHADVVGDTFSYVCVTGIVGGLWEGTLRGCVVSGKISVHHAAPCTSFLFVGGLAGEAYCETSGCESNVDIDVSFDRDDTSEELQAYIGALQGGSTFVDGSEASGAIRLSGNNGTGEVVVGGISGSERYGHIIGSASNALITANNVKRLRFGGITGEYNFQYAAFGMMNGVTKTILKDSHFIGTFHPEKVDTLTREPVCGTGHVPCYDYFGMHMDYHIENCS